MRNKRLWCGILAIICVIMLLAGCGQEPVNTTDTTATQPDITEPGGTEPGGTEPEATTGFAGETGETGEAEKHTYTLDEIRTYYRFDEMMKQYGCVGYETQLFTGGETEPTSDTGTQFKATDSGIQMDEYTRLREGKNRYRQGRISVEYPGAFYMITEDGSKSITVYPDNEYDKELERSWILYNLNGDNETFVGCVYRDGVAVVTTNVDLRSSNGCTDTVEYHINPENNRLVYVERTSRYDGGAPTQTRKITFRYDMTITMEKEPYKEIIKEQNYCEVNVIFDFMTDKQSTQWFPVSDGTSVFVTTKKSDGTEYKLYADTLMTNEFVSAAAAAGASLSIFAVKK